MSEAKTYSHYCWRLEEFPQAEFDKFMSDAVKVLLKCEPMLLIRQMSGECISFQGIEKQLSPFSFSRQYKFNDEFPFRDSTNPERVFFGVRTDKLPFDEVVVAVLLLAKLHFNNGLRLNSDGAVTDLSKGLELLQKALKDKSIQVEDKGNEIVVTREKSKAKYEKEIDINEYVVHDGKIIKASAIPEVKPEKTQEQMIQQLHAKFNKLSKGKSLTLDEAAKVAEKLPDADDIIV